jgi:hypothetical protein
MLFATVALPETLKSFDFYEHYPGRDVPVTTAVRLSSGFPYVVPAARADADGSKGHFTHVVDGGYFDNYGVGTLSAWTHAALMGLTSGERPSRLLIIEICDSEFCSGREPGASPAVGGPRRAWPYQLVAPLTAVVAMRAAAQQVTNRTSLRLLRQYWQTQQVCIESLAVPFGAGDAPLSWHLTNAEKRAIRQKWTDDAPFYVASVRAFLEGRSAACGI